MIKEEQIKQLFTDGDDDTKRFVLLAKLAHEHEWSFEFAPREGAVRISLLPGNGIGHCHSEPLAQSTSSDNA